MKEIGIIKTFDNLGRLVIPKEMRERFFPDNKVEIILTTDGILLTNQKYFLSKKNDEEEK